MKKMKNILALLFCAALAVIVTPSIVHAEVISDNGVSVLIIGHAGCTHDLSELNLPDTSTCHTHVMSSYRYDSDINAKSEDGWSYDVASRTLTLDGFNGSGLWFESTASEDSMLTVKLIGDNTVNGLQYGSEPHGSYYAMGGAWADWDIQGPGSLTVDAYQGIYPTILGGDGLLHISNGAVINVNTYRVGLAADEMIIDSGCVVIANTTKPDDMIEGVVVASNPVATQHTRCNGTLITTNANPGGNGIQSAAFLTAGPNVTLNAGTSAADASARTISSMPSEEYGADTGRFYYEDDYPYMAMIEAGYNGAATVTAPPVTAPTTPVTTLPATVPTQSGMTVMPTPSKVFVNGVETSFEGSECGNR